LYVNYKLSVYTAALPSRITVVVEDYTPNSVKKQHDNSEYLRAWVYQAPRVRNETFQTDSKFLDSCCVFCGGSWRQKGACELTVLTLQLLEVEDFTLCFSSIKEMESKCNIWGMPSHSQGFFPSAAV